MPMHGPPGNPHNQMNNGTPEDWLQRENELNDRTRRTDSDVSEYYKHYSPDVTIRGAAPGSPAPDPATVEVLMQLFPEMFVSGQDANQLPMGPGMMGNNPSPKLRKAR